MRNEDTLKRIRAMARAHAVRESQTTEFAVLDVLALERVIEDAYLFGADAGYTAAKAEERK